MVCLLDILCFMFYFCHTLEESWRHNSLFLYYHKSNVHKVTFNVFFKVIFSGSKLTLPCFKTSLKKQNGIENIYVPYTLSGTVIYVITILCQVNFHFSWNSKSISRVYFLDFIILSCLVFEWLSFVKSIAGYTYDLHLSVFLPVCLPVHL